MCVRRGFFGGLDWRGMKFGHQALIHFEPDRIYNFLLVVKSVTEQGSPIAMKIGDDAI